MTKFETIFTTVTRKFVDSIVTIDASLLLSVCTLQLVLRVALP